MGAKTSILLVIMRFKSQFLIGLSFALLVISSPKAQIVDASKYDRFWLWSGIKSQSLLANAKTIYILDAQIEEKKNGPRLVSQRSATPRTKSADIWIVYRVETLDWQPEIYNQINAHISKWKNAGNKIIGVQIDFDAKTKHLNKYVEFLKDLRTKIPMDYKLGVTGLLDWSNNANPNDLDGLANTVDEVIIQTYQGRHTIKEYQKYFEKISKVKIPFHIGLIQGGQWQEPIDLVKNPNFKGYVIFLQNQPPLSP